jgi:uncharacterized protein YggL (DUF469 family)
LVKVNTIYERIAEIDNDNELAEAFGVELTEIPTLVTEVLKENTSEEEEGQSIKEWLEAQPRKNAEV